MRKEGTCLPPRFLAGAPPGTEGGLAGLEGRATVPARLGSVEVGFSWWLSFSISVVWSLLTVLKRSSVGSDEMCVSELEGLVLVEVAALPLVTTLLQSQVEPDV